MLYWYQEELQAEWEHEVTRSRREQTQYEVSQPAGGVLDESSAPVGFDMADLHDPASGLLRAYVISLACVMSVMALCDV